VYPTAGNTLLFLIFHHWNTFVTGFFCFNESFSYITIYIVIMTLQAAIATVEAAINTVPANGLANGTVYVNSAQLSSSHIPPHMRWPYNEDGTPRSLIDHICRYTSVHLETTTRDTAIDKADIEAGVLAAIARTSASRYHNWDVAHMTPSEVIRVSTTEADLTVHTDHEAAVTKALLDMSAVGTRMMGLFYYNSLSYESFNHQHLPAVSKKLAKTTMNMSGLKDWCEAEQGRESVVFHDTFHPLSDVEKSNAARRMGAKSHLENLKFANIGKRIPVKAPDSGVALNYMTLVKVARSFRHTPEHIPDALDAPRNLITAVQTYEEASTPHELANAVATLRLMSSALAEPSAYLVGLIVGRIANSTNDQDLTLAQAKRNTTILGSPAYSRAASEFAGAYTQGKENGFAKVNATVPDQVLPRVVASVVFAAAIATAMTPATTAAATTTSAATNVAPPATRSNMGQPRGMTSLSTPSAAATTLLLGTGRTAPVPVADDAPGDTAVGTDLLAQDEDDNSSGTETNPSADLFAPRDY